MKIKICGLTNLEDALKAEELGADFLGFVFFPNSKRYVTPEIVRGITKRLRGKARKVGLFLDQDMSFVSEAVKSCALDMVQLHGEEKPGYMTELRAKVDKKISFIKSFKIKKGFDFSCMDPYDMADYFLFDTFKQGMPGGTGESFDWNIVSGRGYSKPVFLAGGLNPMNVKKAISVVRPFAVDVASGVEKEAGKKDHKLLEEFINAAG